MLERKLKGVNFHGTLKALERNHGEEVRTRVESNIDGEAGEAIRTKAVLTGGWYPASWYDALLRSIESEFPGRNHICRELSRQAVMDDFATLFKIISLVASPQMALKNATKIAGRYIDGGKIEMLSAKDGEMHFKFEEFYGYSARMWDDFIGGMEGILDLLKVQRLPTKVLSGGGNSDKLEVLLRYKP